MQAVILAAGNGTRLLPITNYVPKPLFPFWGKPFLGYLLDNLQGFVEEAIIVEGPGDEIADHLGERYGEMPLRYVTQQRPAGTGDALMQTRGLTRESFLVLLGDTCPTRETVAAVLDTPGDAVETLIAVDDPENHLGVSVDGDFCVRELWTQSGGGAEATSLVDAGVFCFSSAIYDVLDGLPPRGKELRVLQGVQQLIQRGAQVRAVQMDHPWLQFGDHEGIGGVLRVMRELKAYAPAAEGPGECSIQTRARDCSLENSLVFGPGELVRCQIRDSVAYCATQVTGKSVAEELVAWV